MPKVMHNISANVPMQQSLYLPASAFPTTSIPTYGNIQPGCSYPTMPNFNPTAGTVTPSTMNNNGDLTYGFQAGASGTVTTIAPNILHEGFTNQQLSQLGNSNSFNQGITYDINYTPIDPREPRRSTTWGSDSSLSQSSSDLSQSSSSGVSNHEPGMPLQHRGCSDEELAEIDRLTTSNLELGRTG